jgi:hypothetical protein
MKTAAEIQAETRRSDERRRRSGYWASTDRWSAADLLAADFPPVRWAVDGVIADGLTILAGSPKVGKSWLALGLAVAVASGGTALGRVPVEQGDVLYLALEDPPRRLQHRLRLVLAGDPPPVGLDVWTGCSRLPKATSELDAWLAEHPAARLVVIDVFARVRPSSDARMGAYDADYAATAALKQLADEHGVAVVFVHHTRKAGSDDWLDTVSGTQGLAGSCDGVLVLRRQRSAAAAELHISGRDVNERAVAMSFAPDFGTWTALDGPATDWVVGETRRRILQLLRDHEGLKPKSIADKLHLDHELVKKTLQRMATAEQVDTDGAGHYSAVPE